MVDDSKVAEYCGSNQEKCADERQEDAGNRHPDNAARRPLTVCQNTLRRFAIVWLDTFRRRGRDIGWRCRSSTGRIWRRDCLSRNSRRGLRLLRGPTWHRYAAVKRRCTAGFASGAVKIARLVGIAQCVVKERRGFANHRCAGIIYWNLLGPRPVILHCRGFTAALKQRRSIFCTSVGDGWRQI